MGVKLDISL